MPTADAAVRISIDHLLEGVQVIGADWTYRYLNETAARQGGRQVQELIGRTMMSCFPGIERTALFTVLDRVMHTCRAERVLNDFTAPDGTTRWFELLVEPVPDGICVLSVEATDRLQAEDRLRQAEKLETVGQFAGGIAHDFNNMLTAIIGYAELIAQQIGPDKPIGRDLQEIVGAAQRAAALTRRLLAFSRKQPRALAAVSLNTVVNQLEPMLRQLMPANIEIRTSLDASVAPIWADVTQLEQIILNLVVNARDAMPDGGVVTITTGAARPGAAEGAVLAVTDTGSGMTPDVKARIFEPFFTTKPAGRGTGLGLSTVRHIIEQLKGAVTVTSEVGRGSAFEITLPHAVAPAPPASPRALPVTAPVGNETILLVEDEDRVRAFVRTVLSRYGYHVVEMATAEEALAVLADERDTIDLLLADVMLVGISGIDLAQRARQRRPGLRVALMTGYSSDIGNALPPETPLLQKPFTASALLTHVRQALVSRPETRSARIDT